MMNPKQRLTAALGTLMIAGTIGGASIALANATPTPGPPPPPPAATEQCDGPDVPEAGDTPDQPGAPDTEDGPDDEQGGPEAPDAAC